MILRTGVLEYPIYSVAAMRRRRQTVYLGEHEHENFTDLFAVNARTHVEEYARFKLYSLDQVTSGQVFNETKVNLIKGENYNVPFIIAPEPGTAPARMTVEGRADGVSVPRQVISCPPALTPWNDSCPTFSCHLTVVADSKTELDQVAVNLTCGGSRDSSAATEVTCYSSLLTDQWTPQSRDRSEVIPQLSSLS